jgi:hypothetical protein
MAKRVIEKYQKYKIYYLIKIIKGTNLTYIMDRIRGVKGVVVARPEYSDKLEDITKRNQNFEFYLIKIKFITDKQPSEIAEEIKDIILTGDENNPKIKGVAFLKPKLDTIAPTA